VEAPLCLAAAPKPNTANAYFKAYEEVDAEGKVQVPQHLQDVTPSAGAAAALLGTYFYSPSEEGYEAQVKDRLARWRAAQEKALDIKRRYDFGQFAVPAGLSGMTAIAAGSTHNLAIVPLDGGAAAPTGTATATDTATSTTTPTPSDTTTATVTGTATATDTATPSATATATDTITATATDTATPTATATATPSATATSTAPTTSTPTPLLAPTATPHMVYLPNVQFPN
jgi:hypothetical protein